MTIRSLLAAGLVAGTLVFPAAAQQGAAMGCPMAGGMMGHGMPMMGQGMSDGGMMGGSMMGGGMMMPGQFVDGRIAFLEAELALTEEQAALFAPVAEAMRSHAAGMQEMHQGMMADGGAAMATLPQRLEHMEAAMTARIESLAALRAAVGPFYDALDETQRAKLDGLMCMM